MNCIDAVGSYSRESAHSGVGTVTGGKSAEDQDRVGRTGGNAPLAGDFEDLASLQKREKRVPRVERRPLHQAPPSEAP